MGFVASFRNALRGIADIVKGERNFRTDLLAAVLVVAAGFVVDLNGAEWGEVVIAIVVVLLAEAVNTSIETVLDLVEPERNELVRKAKDISAGVVLLAACGSVAIGLLAFIPALMRMN